MLAFLDQGPGEFNAIAWIEIGTAFGTMGVPVGSNSASTNTARPAVWNVGSSPPPGSYSAPSGPSITHTPPPTATNRTVPAVLIPETGIHPPFTHRPINAGRLANGSDPLQPVGGGPGGGGGGEVDPPVPGNPGGTHPPFWQTPPPSETNGSALEQPVGGGGGEIGGGGATFPPMPG